MAETFRSDGRAVDVVLPADATKGTPIVAEGWHGILMQDGTAGQTRAIEVAPREHELVVPGGLTLAKGDILYISAAGVLTTTGTDRPFMRITRPKDSNNVVWGILLPQLPV